MKPSRSESYFAESVRFTNKLNRNRSPRTLRSSNGQRPCFMLEIQWHKLVPNIGLTEISIIWPPRCGGRKKWNRSVLHLYRFTSANFYVDACLRTTTRWIYRYVRALSTGFVLTSGNSNDNHKKVEFCLGVKHRFTGLKRMLYLCIVTDRCRRMLPAAHIGGFAALCRVSEESFPRRSMSIYIHRRACATRVCACERIRTRKCIRVRLCV